jgi:hypothetical protein
LATALSGCRAAAAQDRSVASTFKSWQLVLRYALFKVTDIYLFIYELDYEFSRYALSSKYMCMN